jgi:cell division septum initiation protein DivIVA
MSDPTEPVPAVDAPTTGQPVVDSDGRQPWTVSQLTTRLRALDRVGRGRNAGYAAKQVDQLVDDAVFTISHERRQRDCLDDKLTRLSKDHRGARTALWEAREHIERLENPEAYGRTPTTAVAAVVGGRSFAEHIVVDAEAAAARVVANAEEDARRIRAAARLDVQTAGLADRPGPTGDLAHDTLAGVRWLAGAVDATRERVDTLTLALASARDDLADLTDELDRFAEVLPIARAELPGATLDVAEIEVAS